MPREMTPAQIEYIKENYAALGPSEIAKRLGLGKNQIVGKAYRMGLRCDRTAAQATADYMRRLPQEERRRRQALAWSRMTPEQRRDEMRRRWHVRKGLERPSVLPSAAKPPPTPGSFAAEVAARRQYERDYAYRLREAERIARGGW